MPELDRRHRAVLLQEAGDAFQRRGLAVVPQPDVAMGDAALRRHRRGLDHDDAGAALREFAEMHEVPVIGDAIDRRILAHRRKQDAIFGCYATKRDRLEQ